MWAAPIPEGLAADRFTGEPVRELPVTAAVVAAGAIGVVRLVYPRPSPLNPKP